LPVNRLVTPSNPFTSNFTNTYKTFIYNVYYAKSNEKMKKKIIIIQKIYISLIRET